MSKLIETKSYYNELDVYQHKFFIKYKGNFRLHNPKGPALISYFSNGGVQERNWYRYGEYHRLDGPAVQIYHYTSHIRYEIWFRNNVHHRIDGPAYINYDENGIPVEERWEVDGLKHRIGLPARIIYKVNPSGSQFPIIHEWYYNDKLHRVDGPAKIIKTVKHDIEEWWINGVQYPTLQIEEMIEKMNLGHWSKWSNEETLIFKMLF